MAGKRADTLLASMTATEWFTLQRVWEVTDDELLWDPVPGAWGVRRREDCRTADPFGAGDLVVDFDIDRSMAEGGGPMTTIGWLLWHVASLPGRLVETDVLGGDRAFSTGWASPYLTHHPIFTSGAEAATTWRDGWNALRAALQRADDDLLERPIANYSYAPLPPAGGLLALGPPGLVLPAGSIVAGALLELTHHGSQICTLRDLFAARA